MVPSLSQLAGKLIVTAQQAGCAIMGVYAKQSEVFFKDDMSPVTEADKLAEAIILAALAEAVPDIPVVSEEAAADGHIPAFGDTFFLVDPLDGTKEFIRRSDEFTVNIALVDHGKPIFGLVYAPAMQLLYITPEHGGAAMARLDPCGSAVDPDALPLSPIATRVPPEDGLAVVASRSHLTAETSAYIDRFKVAELKSAGSSLKFCLVATGEADLYPRFGPTMEWDTAAGHAVLAAAGGEVVMANGQALLYGQDPTNFLNPSFIAAGRRSLLTATAMTNADPRNL